MSRPGATVRKTIDPETTFLMVKVDQDSSAAPLDFVSFRTTLHLSLTQAFGSAGASDVPFSVLSWDAARQLAILSAPALSGVALRSALTMAHASDRGARLRLTVVAAGGSLMSLASTLDDSLGSALDADA